MVHFKTDWLFSTEEIRDLIQALRETIKQEISRLPKNQLLNTPTEDLSDDLENSYRMDVPQVLEDEIFITDHGETEIDVSRDPQRAIRDRSRPAYVPGSYAVFVVPFSGDASLLEYGPTSFTTSKPFGVVRGGEIHFRFEQLGHDEAELKGAFETNLASVKKHLEWLESDADNYNSQLRPFARNLIEDRKQRLLKDDRMVADLGYPLKKRDDAPKTYVLPVTRKKAIVRRLANVEKAFEPEPAIAENEYDSILGIIQNMALVLERSPKAFISMGEEDLRQHFLVQLNGQYEGNATGETFNGEGKTDILIREKGKNVFIAECKFWKGPKQFLQAIDQLLGYTSWRDTKTAILLFNRNRNLSSVLEKVPSVVEGHSNYKRPLDYGSETGFRFAMHQHGDANREILLTILVFDVPTD